MPVVAVFRGVTREQYEESVRKLTGGKSQMEAPADWPVERLLAHAAGEGGSGFRVVDVWSSEGTLQRFAEILIPILREIGVEGEPETYPAHTFVAAYPRHVRGRRDAGRQPDPRDLPTGERREAIEVFSRRSLAHGGGRYYLGADDRRVLVTLG